MFGVIFKEIIGKSASDFESISQIEAEVEQATKHGLSIVEFESNLVPSRGNILPYKNKKRNLDAEVDALLPKRLLTAK